MDKERTTIIRGPVELALVAPDKAKQFSSHGWCLVRLTYFTQMGLAGLIRLHMRRAQLAKRRLRPPCHCRVLSRMVCCSRNKQIAIANSQLDHGIFLPLLEQAFDPEERQTASRRHKSSKEQIVEVPLIMSHRAFRKTEHKGFEGDKIR